MTVKELITYLLDQNLDADVSIWSPGAVVTAIKTVENDPRPQVYLIVEQAG
jgi:hypothetical protein